MVKKLHLNENVQNHFLLLEPDWNKQVYIVRDEADSVQEIKTLAQEWCDSDRFRIPTEHRKGHDIIYYGYCPETKKVYLPRWYTKADVEPFNYNWEIYGIEDYITEDVQSNNYYNSREYYRSPEYAESGDWYATMWNGYIDEPYTCACCGRKFPAGRNDVYLDGYEPDGMHFIYRLTKENRDGNGINYDPYNLPPEDSEGSIFKVVVCNENDDEGYYWRNFCRNCWPKLTKYSPEELANKFEPGDKLL